MKKRPIFLLALLMTLVSVFSIGSAAAGTVTGLPLGPAFGPSPQLALTDGTVTNDGTNLDVTLNFSTAISPPAAGAANSVFGYVLLDTDQSTTTGLSVSQLDGPLGLGLGGIPAGQVPSGLGVDYAVSLDSVGGTVPGDVDVISTTSLLTLASVPISYTSNSLSFSIPISDLTDPVAVNSLVNFGAIVGNPSGPTDTLLGIASTTVPEPSSIVMVFTSVILVGGLIRFQQRGPGSVPAVSR